MLVTVVDLSYKFDEPGSIKNRTVLIASCNELNILPRKIFQQKIHLSEKVDFIYLLTFVTKLKGPFPKLSHVLGPPNLKPIQMNQSLLIYSFY